MEESQGQLELSLQGDVLQHFAEDIPTSQAVPLEVEQLLGSRKEPRGVDS